MSKRVGCFGRLAAVLLVISSLLIGLAAMLDDETVGVWVKELLNQATNGFNPKVLDEWRQAE